MPLNNFYNQIILMLTINNGSAFLIDWINKERSQVGQEHPLYDFEHVRKTGFVYEFLQKIHPRYFIELSPVSFDFQTYVQTIESYLMENEGKKITRRYRKSILEQESIQEIIKICLFLVLQGPQKSHYIARIVEMNVEVQGYLMQEIKKVQESMENHIEIKDILVTVEKLQEENETLKDKLKSYTEENLQLTEQMNEAQQENLKTQNERKRYQTEKKRIFDELQIVDMKQYVEVYKGIKNENSQMNTFVQHIEESKKEVELENKAMKERITEDCQVINQLNEEIVNLKHNYSNIKEQMSTLSFSCDHIPDGNQDSVLRENKNFGNVNKIRFSLQSSLSDKSMFLNHFYDDEESNENEKLRNYNQEILHKLEVCHKTINDLTNEVTTLKEDRSKVEKRNQFLENKMGDLKKEQNRFTRELKKMGF